MKIESITLQNYGTFYGPHNFSFDERGLVLVMGENLDEPRLKSNGAGKSTVFDALDWALFGDIPRGDHVDSIVNEEAGGNTKVQVDLADEDGAPVRVIRWRGVKGHTVKPNGVGLWFGPTDKTALDDAETQRLIERALGLDREVFHALVLHAQTDTWNFAAASDAERIAVLTKVLQLDMIDGWLERAKEKAAAGEQRLQKLNGGLTVLQGQHAELTRLDYSVHERAWNEEHAIKVQTVRESLARLEASAVALRQTVPGRGDLDARTNALRAREPQRPTFPPAPAAPTRPPIPKAPTRPIGPVPPDRTELVVGYGQAEAAIVAAQTDIQVKRREAEVKHRAADEFSRTQTGTCGACRQPISAVHVAVEVERLRNESQAIVASLVPSQMLYEKWVEYKASLDVRAKVLDDLHVQAVAAYQADLSRLDSAHEHEAALYNAEMGRIDSQYQDALGAHRVEVQRLESWYSSLASAHAVEVSKLQQEARDIEGRERLAAHAEAVVAQERQRLESWATEKNPWVQKAVELRHRLADLDQAIDHDTKEIEAERDTARYVDFWVQGLGPRGLKNFIMDARVQELTDAANHWMRLIFGGTSWVRFETQVQGRSTGKLTNRLNIRSFRYMPDGAIRERNFKSLSGGEKQRTSLAIDMGLSRLIASRASKRYDLLVLDEVFKHLDSAGREAVVDMLHQLQAEKSSIFVVDHDAEFQGAFEHRVVVRKQNGRSIILDGIPNDQDVSGSVPKEAGKADQKAVPSRRPVSRTPVSRRPGA